MVFLTSLDILDTGFLTVTSRTNQLGTTYRVNSGDSMRLKSVNFDITSSASNDKSVSPGYSPDDIKDHESRSLISINPIIITLSIVINASNTSTSNAYEIDDMELLKELLKLPNTAGFKAVYYPVDNTANDTGANSTNRRDNQIVYQLGETDTTEDQGDLASGTHVTLWTGTTSTATGKDLTDVNYIPVRFDSCKILQIASNKIKVTLQGVVTG